ncbi:hypothetical protein TrRE_jg10707 [Triparma retinervis]|uniref:Cdc23 domain-containing protein n=1 Tax=Triparma retinervis TaxID=2557542 RepID=A0A9W7FBT9_9STRA|nr:hypothetical protein TrRE_jg10707 [Triparma retinervis]
MDWDPLNTQKELQNAIITLSQYGLKLSTKCLHHHSFHHITLSRSLLDLGEYTRLASLLSDPVDPSAPKDDLPPLGLWLWAYGNYLGGEKRKEEEIGELSTTAPTSLLHDALLSQTRDALVSSILSFRWNWSAWLDLAAICVDNATIHESVEEALKPLQDHYMYMFFLAHVFLEQQQNDQALQVIERLQSTFPNSNALQSQTALAHYNLRDFDRAQECYVDLVEADPYRLEGMDVFSNILYVKEAKAELSALAQSASNVDKYRPEVCCIIGNYYSLKSHHTLAVSYFQRALKLNRNFLSAWTLMGHEYVEMRKTDKEAIKSYERAVITNDRENLATKKLAKLYREEGDAKKAADCYLRLIDNLGSSVDQGSAEALLFLAQYFKNIKNYENSALMCSRLLEYPGPEKEEAQALLRDIRSRRQATS